MQRIDHPLLSPSLGSHKTLTSFHFGAPHSGAPKVYIQASLHADELPGMLVAHHLHTALATAEQAGRLQGEVVLVPLANPIGLAQRVDHKAMGRFELASSENFNRQFPDLLEALWPDILQALGPDADANRAAIRRAAGRFLTHWTPTTELQSQRRTLLLLAHDADYVLDLHCDCEAVLHFYTEVACWPQFESLTRLLQCQAVLLARNSGGDPFDECLSGLWWRLAERLAAHGHALPVPQGCCSATIELRGEIDVAHDLARADAQAILQWLGQIGVLRLDALSPIPLPCCAPTPLAGSETLCATQAGLVVFAAAVGQRVQAGDLVAEVIDPISGDCQRICASVQGVLYARIRERYVHAGGELGKVAGATAFRSGPLLGF
ncbi:MAG: succinylglutamate desuccinylase/aspartoacylase family protein [Rhodoferax sp.]